MHDTLKFLSYNPFYRGQIHYEITFSMAYHYSENFILPLSHDEVVHGKKSLLEKMHGDYDEKFNNFKLLFAYMILHPGKKLSFMGNEYAPFLEWRYYEPLEWFMIKYPRHKSIYDFMVKLNNFYLRQPALWELDYDYSGFKWIDADNINQSVLIFMRQGESDNEKLIIVINFSNCYYENFNIGVPAFEKYRCVFNTDLDEFGGGNHNTKKQVKVKPVETNDIWHGYKQYIDVHIPPLSVIVYKPVNRKKGK
jgi:1,4-alpha-glucan branching enzyme